MATTTLKVSGMSCGHCVGQVTKVLTQLEGVRVDAVRVGRAEVAYDPGVMTPSEIARAVTEAGYDIQSAGRAV